MKQVQFNIALSIIVFFCYLTIHAQEIKVTDKDMSIKEIIYNENRVKY
jgi:hypothetical protein